MLFQDSPKWANHSTLARSTGANQLYLSLDQEHGGFAAHRRIGS